MTRLGTYMLLFIMLFSNLPGSQLCKLPTLLQHFREHQQRDPQIGFIRFLAMHYWGKDINDNDDERDNQLPFKKDTIVYSACYHLTPVTIQIALPATASMIVHYAINEYLHTDAHLHSLFKPPKTIA